LRKLDITSWLKIKLTPRSDSPQPLDVFVRVGPEQVAEQAGVGHVGRPHDFVDLVEVGELRGETAVHAQDLLVDQGGDRQAVEAVGHQLP
jgi:hypothetical protein